MKNGRRRTSTDLHQLARRAMIERGLEPDFPEAVHAEVRPLVPPSAAEQNGSEDLRRLHWISIDNDDSLDLDQLSVAEAGADGGWVLRVAVADVDHHVTREGAVDLHAARNTTSV